MTAHVLGSAGFAAAFAACGLCLGLGYFALLRRSVATAGAAARQTDQRDRRHYGRRDGRRGNQRDGRRSHVLALTLVRLGCAAAFFVLAAHVGAPALLGGFAGFLGARTLALHRVRNAS